MKPAKCLNSLLLLSVAMFALTSVASAEWKESVLYSFQGGTDGATPAGGVVFDAAGNLYGATTDGGAANCSGPFQCGTVYQLKPPARKGDPWTETVLYIFKGTAANDGASPFGGLVMDATGNLYGTTGYDGTGNCLLFGGRVGCGTVYELSPPAQKGGAWTETVIYNFRGNKDGQLPVGDLVFDKQGNLYGATQYGGGFGSCNPSFYQHCGTVFKLSPPKTKGGKWTEKVLHGFKGGADGANPNGGLVFDGKGAIYGTTLYGGGSSNCNTTYSAGCGTAFKLSRPGTKGGAWTETVIRRFKDDANGGVPNGGLILDHKGTLYSTAVAGGKGHGIVFCLVPPTSRGGWTETLLHSFNGADGAEPMAGLTFDPTGNLYGTTCCDGKPGGGTTIRLRPLLSGAWAPAVLHAFTGPPDGTYPASSLILDGTGKLYGTTQLGGYTGQNCGHNGCGIVFEVQP